MGHEIGYLLTEYPKILKVLELYCSIVEKIDFNGWLKWENIVKNHIKASDYQQSYVAVALKRC